jgi:hypothetical protein
LSQPQIAKANPRRFGHHDDTVVPIAERKFFKYFGGYLKRFHASRLYCVQRFLYFIRISGILRHKRFRKTHAGRDCPRNLPRSVDNESPATLPIAATAQPNCVLYPLVLPARYT